MFFPLSVKNIVRDPFDPAGRIDREIADRSRRIAIGTRLEDDLESVSSALVVATGKGKYLRILSAVTTNHSLPEFTAKLLKAALSGDCNPTIADLQTLRTEVALAQAGTIEELKSSAGKYVDRLLVISVTQPDAVQLNSHGEVRWPVQLTDAHVLAEQTGLSVITSFAYRDILAGGNGQNLDALPAWILFSDRAQRVAATNRVLFSIDGTARAFFLPASDGIDSDLPDVRMAHCDGLNRFNILSGSEDKLVGLNDLNKLNLSGVDLQLNSIELTQRIESEQISGADFVRSSVVNIVDEISQRMMAELTSSMKVGEIVVQAAPEIMGIFANQFRRAWPHANVYDGFGWDGSSSHLKPILAATLGILSIDQLPTNIPWITGANSQKVLGTLTPGSPANWRQLLRDMADFQPPVMRLRDAV